jgi:hypothetical protein
MFVKNTTTVFSIDLIMSLLAAVIGELASLKGLKLSTALMILFDTDARRRTSPPNPLSVAVTRSASLHNIRMYLLLQL